MTPKKPSGWTQDEIDAVAACLTDDLRDAGPQFSIKFTPLSPRARAIASVPPNDAPPAASDPGSGGFIEDWHLERPAGGQGLDALPEEVKRLMGSMHAALGEPAETAIALNVDGDALMWLEFWSGLDHVEHWLTCWTRCRMWSWSRHMSGGRSAQSGRWALHRHGLRPKAH